MTDRGVLNNKSFLKTLFIFVDEKEKTMKTKLFWTVIILSQMHLYSGVPYPQTHQPASPYFMEQINFQSILLKTFGNDISGIVTDKYSDMSWNPAFILGNSENGVYMDFNYSKSRTSYYKYYHSPGYDAVVPNWYRNTSITSLQMDPLYNFAFVKKITPKISIGVINRSIFDYGPFRSSSRWRDYNSSGMNSSQYDDSAYKELELKTIEVNGNQQTVWGTQSEIYLGYKLSSKIDIGIKFGHYIFRRWGNLDDSKYSKQPHSFVNSLNDEDFNIDGNHYEFGGGLIYHFDKKTDIGIFASIMNGSSSENNTSSDHSEYWSERATEPDYYSVNKYNLSSNNGYSSDGNSPFFTLTFQKEISSNLLLRSFFSYRQTKNSISGSILSTDTTYSDRTYDSWDHNSTTYFFTRNEDFRGAESTLSGSGNEQKRNYKWFASLIYKTDNEWSAFAAIIIKKHSLNLESSENSTYYQNLFSQRYYYKPGTSGQYNSFIKNYQYIYNSNLWSAILPVGIKANIIGGFSLLIGTDLKFELVEIKESGDMLYPQRINRRTEDGNIVLEDIETNRPETYNSDQPKVFNKTSAIHLGAFYAHSSGIKIYVRTSGDILDKNSWAFGVEYVF